MSCKCENFQSTFNGEVAIHFRGIEGWDKSLMFVFPKLMVCLHCGLTEFTVPELELRVLVGACPVEGAAVL
jgi:hypothetical protein